jgi:sugar phosphate isomerase/epimerase
LKEGVSFLEQIPGNRILLLADLFHMNIEEESIWQALTLAKDHLGYLHFVDSNRRAPGLGHLNFGRLSRVLREIRYDGFISAEALPHPSSEEAARKTIEYFRRFIQPLAQERPL